jgi:hypothetical protein
MLGVEVEAKRRLFAIGKISDRDYFEKNILFLSNST